MLQFRFLTPPPLKLPHPPAPIQFFLDVSRETCFSIGARKILGRLNMTLHRKSPDELRNDFLASKESRTGPHPTQADALAVAEKYSRHLQIVHTVVAMDTGWHVVKA